MKLGIIGNGAIAQYVRGALETRGHSVAAYLVRPERVLERGNAMSDGISYVSEVADLPADIDHMIDCAGHGALIAYGAGILEAGFDLTTVSIGALADQKLYDALHDAARTGGATLRLATGAIGALDALGSARVGALKSVRYVGRKPPQGWKGSPAQDRIDLDALGQTAQTHFSGTARQAALDYPKNANVAAAVALAGVGFDATTVDLIADPTITANIHEIHAVGDFGTFEFRINGETLPGNPKTSALAAMSVVSAIEQTTQPIRF